MRTGEESFVGVGAGLEPEHHQKPKRQNPDSPILGRAAELLASLAAGKSEAENRQSEERLLTTILRNRLVSFREAQLAAELIALHKWTDTVRATGLGSTSSRAAGYRLTQLQSRRSIRRVK